MPINYDRWNNLDDYTSSDEDTGIKITPPTGFKQENATLITVPWDTNCEAVRWTLDRHNIPYTEHNYPYGPHLFATLPHSDPPSPTTSPPADTTSSSPDSPSPQPTLQTSIPILITSKNETYKRSPTQIYLYIYSHALSSRLRIYDPPHSLDLQQHFDTNLMPAARTIFFHTLLSTPSLHQKYIHDQIWLQNWKEISHLSWPLIKPFIKWKFGITKKGVEESWRTITETFNLVETHLTSHPHANPYICGKTLTTADISFASHCIPILFPNPSTESWASKLGISVPGLSELPPELAKKVKALRETKAGRHAIRMYAKERGETCGKRPSKFERRANPWWCKEGRLRKCLGGFCVASLVVGLVLFWLLPWWGLVLGWLTILGCGVGGWWWKGRGTVVEERVGQLGRLVWEEVKEWRKGAGDGTDKRGGKEVEKREGLAALPVKTDNTHGSVKKSQAWSPSRPALRNRMTAL